MAVDMVMIVVGLGTVLAAWLHYTERISHGNNPYGALDSIFTFWLLGVAFTAMGILGLAGFGALSILALMILGFPGLYIIILEPRWTQPQWRRDQIEAHEATRRAAKADRRKRR